jgi:hypothetical protein
MTKRYITFALLACCVVSCLSARAFPQDSVYQRAFPVSPTEAKAAVQRESVTSKGRLPTLDGFVQQTDVPLDRYDKGYYDCSFQITAAPGGGVTIRVSAKVTAWLTDPDPNRSGYRVLNSNGRLESDILDRIAERLSLSMPPPAPAEKSSAPATAKLNLRIADKPGAALPPGTTLESVRALRDADEKRSQDLAKYVANLEEIRRNQSRPSDLAAVKKSGSPIYSKPSESSQVLMKAEAQDEFQVVGMDGPWVHVQISGVSRGWMYRSQLEMPSGFTPPTVPGETKPWGNGTFKVAKEETSPFSGSWAPLKGKSVRIEWVEPKNPAVTTSREEKLAFAKSVFLRTSENLPASAQADGIVVVFDSADGGQIAASLTSVKALSNHILTEDAFWHQCVLDPRDSFLDY